VYSETAQRLIVELPNRGKLQDATHTARAENPVCGDITDLFLKVEKDVVVACRFQTYGCPAAIAASAAVTQLCGGKSLEACRQITSQSILDFLEGLPRHKLHGADLAAEALEKALREGEGTRSRGC